NGCERRRRRRSGFNGNGELDSETTFETEAHDSSDRVDERRERTGRLKAVREGPRERLGEPFRDDGNGWRRWTSDRAQHQGESGSEGDVETRRRDFTGIGRGHAKSRRARGRRH